MASKKKKKSPAQKDQTSHVKDVSAVQSVQTEQSPAPAKESTQREIGLFYVRAFVIIIGGVILLTLIFCYSVTDIKDLLLAISGVLSGPLGFIIGFYFKEELQNKNNL